MDFYLDPENCYQRLEDEFKKYGKLIFCVDFDDTLYDFHNVGRTYTDKRNRVGDRMNEFYIKVDSVDKVKDFVKATNKIVPDMDLIVGRYIIDAKSIMGIFSVDLTRKIRLKIHSDNEKECTEIRKKLEKFIVE